jgi:enamine deaminase RidA (YjgF/YER057c/UK114 family)
LTPGTQTSATQEHTSQALLNCIAVVEAGGGTKDAIAYLAVLLINPTGFAEMDEACAAASP